MRGGMSEANIRRLPATKPFHVLGIVGQGENNCFCKRGGFLPETHHRLDLIIFMLMIEIRCAAGLLTAFFILEKKRLFDGIP